MLENSIMLLLGFSKRFWLLWNMKTGYKIPPPPHENILSHLNPVNISTYYSSSFLWDWVHLLRRPLIGLLYQPRMIDDDEYGVVGGMRIGRGNRSTRRKPAPVPLCLPQIPHELLWARTRAAAVGSRRLTAWAMTLSPTSLTQAIF
jgi:hypothetical protein